ncbi:hypothetical protein BLNAU_19590 [Blattamonas nauphoetae]|uniref:Uncharacterized protein n=1 Tax=Blattamonas nauphoetae TaxID=2049346 RepID=A0ABQ9X1F4_9EUKA|nr:hypothetical protein BLNAU_19590 [Blattamonas nauphoetae]
MTTRYTSKSTKKLCHPILQTQHEKKKIISTLLRMFQRRFDTKHLRSLKPNPIWIHEKQLHTALVSSYSRWKLVVFHSKTLKVQLHSKELAQENARPWKV